MLQRPPDRDVQSSLLTSRTRRRRKHDVPDPVVYSPQMADFDVWNNMFLASSSKNGLTMHKPPRPPTRVLDLGCGTGYWVVEAAKAWPNSTIYGFDIATIQPTLHNVEHLKDISQRIEWVHGNFLDGLPFPSDHFDFVRVAGMGLAIPEDEWQPVLEQIHRVLAPGGILEIIEEDLIFPCASLVLRLGSHHSSFPITPPTVHMELSRSKSTNFLEHKTISSDLFSTSPHTPQEPIKLSSRFSSLLPSTRHSSASTLKSTPTSSDLTCDTEHPQDHTRLRLAWDEMLHKRFLSPKAIAVIPFYLMSASFVGLQAHPPLTVPLPSNSNVPSSYILPALKSVRSLGSIRSQDMDDYFLDSQIDFGASLSNRSFKTDGCSIRSITSQIGWQVQSEWSPMHLAKTVNTIQGCKEAIWTEYKEMYSKDALQILHRTAPNDEDYACQPYSYVLRQAFEVDWKNWELDMMDRMDMRSNMHRQLAWTQRPDGERECHAWRENLKHKPLPERTSGHLIAAHNPEDLCRSLRAFTCFKT